MGQISKQIVYYIAYLVYLFQKTLTNPDNTLLSSINLCKIWKNKQTNKQTNIQATKIVVKCHGMVYCKESFLNLFKSNRHRPNNMQNVSLAIEWDFRQIVNYQNNPFTSLIRQHTIAYRLTTPHFYS